MHNAKRFCAISAAALLVAGSAGADEFIMMPDSSRQQVVLFDPDTGLLVDASFINLLDLPAPLESRTPVHAIVVEDEIWITEQLDDRVDRFDLEDQSYIGSITEGIDNVRGIAYIDGTVYLTNANDGNNAPGRAIIKIDPNTAEIIGSFPTADNGSPWSIIPDGDDIFVSNSATNRIDRYNPDTGDFIGTFYDGQARFIQQLHRRSNNNIYAAAFSGVDTSGVWEIDARGNELGRIVDFGGLRGVWELGNGNILWSNGQGAWIHDVNTGQDTLMYDGSGRHFGLLSTAEPCIADWNGDGEVDINDFFAYLSDFEDGDPRADLNNDGETDINDFFIFLQEFEEGC